MLRYIKSSEEVDDYLGFDLWDTQELLDELDRAIGKSKINASTSGLNILVDKIFISDRFNDAVNDLIKDHKTDILSEIKDTIIRLVTNPNAKTKGSHRLQGDKKSNPNRLSDLHLEHKNIILLYRYAGKDALVVDLKLFNLTDHKNIDRDLKKNYADVISIDVDDDLDKNLKDYLHLN